MNVILTEKTCGRCGETKPVDEMKRDTRNRDGFSSFCKLCHQKASVAWQKANPERLNAGRRARYQRIKHIFNPLRREVRQANVENARWQVLETRYHVTREWYEQMLVKQGGGCAICGRNPDPSKRRFSVDHNHKCCKRTPTCGNCNRGILCHSCNMALHLVETHANWSDKASAYLGATS